MYKTLEEAQKAYDAKKKESRAAYDAIKAFEKENKLGFGRVPADKKLAKKQTELKAKHDELKAELGVIETAIRELKPKVERSSFVKKYEYPANPDGSEMSADDKKAYRRKARAAAKKGEKMEADEKPAKGAEKSGKKETPSKPVKKVAKKLKPSDEEGEED